MREHAASADNARIREIVAYDFDASRGEVALRPQALRSSERTAVRMLHPETRELAAWSPSTLKITLPRQAEGYAAVAIERW